MCGSVGAAVHVCGVGAVWTVGTVEVFVECVQYASIVGVWRAVWVLNSSVGRCVCRCCVKCLECAGVVRCGGLCGCLLCMVLRDVWGCGVVL